MMNSSTVAVIPAAGLGTRLMPISSTMPKAMIPIAGQPLISLIVNNLARQGVRRFVVVVGHHAEQLENYLEHTYKNASLKVNVVRQPLPLDGPLSAVRVAQKCVGDNPQVVVLGDTLTRDNLLFDRDFILAYPVDDYSRWCLATLRGDGTLDRLYDKTDTPPPVGKPYLALIGVYYFQDSRLWQHCINEVYKVEEKKGNPYQGYEYQLSSAIERYNKERPIAVRRAREWFDCGNIDRYIETRRLLLQSRSANRIWVDELGVLHKRSDGSEDLQNEIHWYSSIPPCAQPLVPRVFGYSLDQGNTFINLEYIPIPTLAEFYLYANVHPEVWKFVITQTLDLWHRVFFSYVHGEDEPSEDTAKHTLSMYWDKTQKRLQEVAQDSAVAHMLRQENITFNGKELKSWSALAPEVEKFLRSAAEKCHWSLIHGDLHFGNILFDFNSGHLKILDPRGAFGSVGCFGDAHYDLAKFLHSFHGGYAHLSAGMFELSEENDRYELSYYGGTNRSHLFEVFRQWMETKGIGLNINELILIEGILFLSMLPYHADDPRRQIAAYLTGLSLVTEALDSLRRRQSHFRVCIDLDGTICEIAKAGEYATVKPKPGAREALQALKQRGAYIIIYTARRMRTHSGNVAKVIAEIGELTRNWLARYDIPYDELVFGKPYAQIYIDDLCLPFEQWEGMVESIEKKIGLKSE